MANRSFRNQQFLSFFPRIVNLFPVVKVGAAGAVTLQSRQFQAAGAGSSTPKFSLVAAPTTGVGYAKGDGAGVNSVTRTGTGAWTVTLSDPYQYLLSVDFTLANATGANTAGNLGVLTGGNVTTNTSTGSGGTIQLLWQSGSYAATDPASGDIIYLRIMLGDSSEY